MTGRYSAFTFCDRITEYEPAQHAQGEFLVPDHLTGFSPSLCAEATGQLAAWVAMANIGFRGRPVAALAKEVRILGNVVPGDTLVMKMELTEPVRRGLCIMKSRAWEYSSELSAL